MNLIDQIRCKAKENPKTIVLPEGFDQRVLRAASFIQENGLAKIIILGQADKVAEKAKAASINLKNIEIINPATASNFEAITQQYFELRKHKGISRDDARKTVSENRVFYAAMMVRNNLADGFVAGADYTTKDVARAAIHCLGINRELPVVSSAFIIIVPNCASGEKGLFIFADCGIVPDPSAKQLADIAFISAKILEQLSSIKPKVAMLSFSTHGSASSDSVNKVSEAVKMAKAKYPDLLIDGELQADAAIIPEVAEVKSPLSPIKGEANILIFPNLDAGNICYKLVQRLAKARAIGPLLQGLNKPCSDLSRGCGVEDIIDAVAVTVVRAQKC